MLRVVIVAVLIVAGPACSAADSEDAYLDPRMVLEASGICTTPPVETVPGEVAYCGPEGADTRVVVQLMESEEARDIFVSWRTSDERTLLVQDRWVLVIPPGRLDAVPEAAKNLDAKALN